MDIRAELLPQDHFAARVHIQCDSTVLYLDFFGKLLLGILLLGIVRDV